MILDQFAQGLALAACIIIIVRAESAINHMSRCTPFLVRMAFWLLLVGAVGAAARVIITDDVPPWPAVLGVWGAALLLFCPRRLRYFSKAARQRPKVAA